MCKNIHTCTKNVPKQMYVLVSIYISTILSNCNCSRCDERALFSGWHRNVATQNGSLWFSPRFGVFGIPKALRLTQHDSTQFSLCQCKVCHLQDSRALFMQWTTYNVINVKKLPKGSSSEVQRIIAVWMAHAPAAHPLTPRSSRPVDSVADTGMSR